LKSGAHVTIYYEDRQYAPVAVAIEAVSRLGMEGEARVVDRELAG
jgi:hypothetical protein